MFRYIKVNSVPYSTTVVDLTAPECQVLSVIDDNYDNLEEFVTLLLEDYRYYLTHYKSKGTKIDMWMDRAEIIIDQYIQHGKVTARDLEADFCIGRTLVTNCLRDLRTVITLRRENKLYKE